MDQTTSARVTHESPQCGARRTYHNLTDGCNVVCGYCNIEFTYHPTAQDIAAAKLRAHGLNAVVNDDTHSFVSVIYPHPVHEPQRICQYSGVVYDEYYVSGFDSYLNTKVETVDAFVERVIATYHKAFPAETKETA